jgi:hypothetical protein
MRQNAGFDDREAGDGQRDAGGERDAIRQIRTARTAWRQRDEHHLRARLRSQQRGVAQHDQVREDQTEQARRQQMAGPVEQREHQETRRRRRCPRRASSEVRATESNGMLASITNDPNSDSPLVSRIRFLSGSGRAGVIPCSTIGATSAKRNDGSG